MAAVDLDAGASSSTKLWATASKEWVIQPKPKPGRKPKKEAANNEVEDSAGDGKGRRVQNRAAQRAFRERKQTQLAELQARIQSYEQGEIERNVALQNVAKRLKEENDALRAENKLLTEKLSKLGQLLEAASDTGKKRSRPPSPGLNLECPHSKKPKSQCPPQTEFRYSSYSLSPPSLVSSPEPTGNGYPESHDSPFSYDSPPDTSHTNMDQIMDFSDSMKLPELSNNELTFGCGFCTEASHCVCKDFLSNPIDVPDSERISDSYKASSITNSANDTLLPNSGDAESTSTKPQTSILDHLPAYQPAVPLRRRQPSSTVKSIFPIRPAPKPSTLLALCSGDPSNCLACADDSFGKAFCSAMRESVANETPCSADCATEMSSTPKGCIRPCCSSSKIPSLPQMNEPPRNETIPTSDAWRQIKNHPNVSFADLALLADVVSRRSKCTGPRVVISPAPGSITPERTVSPSQLEKRNSYENSELCDDLDHMEQGGACSISLASPTPIPKEDWIRQRVCEVQKDAVETALHMLDNKFA